MRNRSSQSGGRSPLSGVLWTPDRSETSQSSGSSAAERNPLLAAAARAIGSCFRPMDSRSSMNELSEEFKPYTTTESSSASSHGSLRNRSAKGIYRTGNSSARSESGVMKFTVSDIHRATKNFSPSLKIGQGGFGAVYKGTLDDGSLVAVKRAKKSIYDSNVDVEFQSEVRTLSQIEHLNLVRFLGYLEYDDEKIVVIEYVPKGTLREHLDGLHGNQLDLGARLDIAIDVAHAITYLHMYAERPIIHRDIKSSNILLTENLRAKVADFGFARLGATETGISHVSTQVKGTAGYLDPEYLRTYQLTEKSDVYSFGVLLVELMSGRRPIEPKRELKERITTKWAMRKFSDGEAIQALDPNLRRNPATNLALEKTMELSLQCLAPTRLSRPSMKRCAEILWSIRKDYRELLLSSDPPSNQRKPSFTEERKPSFTEEREFIKPLN